MKKTYQKPIIRTIALHQQAHLLSASDPTKRNVAGGPTQDGLPTSVVEGFNPDGLFDGQNGNSLRSREWFGDDDW